MNRKLVCRRRVLQTYLRSGIEPEYSRCIGGRKNGVGWMLHPMPVDQNFYIGDLCFRKFLYTCTPDMPPRAGSEGLFSTNTFLSACITVSCVALNITITQCTEA